MAEEVDQPPARAVVAYLDHGKGTLNEVAAGAPAPTAGWSNGHAATAVPTPPGAGQEHARQAVDQASAHVDRSPRKKKQSKGWHRQNKERLCAFMAKKLAQKVDIKLEECVT